MTDKQEPVAVTQAEQLAQSFHETYERLAPTFGYKTREASAKPWADVPASNKALMIAVCGEILFRHRLASRSGGEVEQDALIVGLRERIDSVIEFSGHGCWMTCTGCYESEDGYPNGHYPHSEVLGCALGGGCSECGGIGAVFDDTDWDSAAREMLAMDAALSTREPTRDEASYRDKLIELIAGRGIGAGEGDDVVGKFALEVRHRIMREALEWYGEQARLARLIHSEGDAGRHALAEDGGKRALAALSTPAPEAGGEVARLREELAATYEELIDHLGDDMNDSRSKRVDELRAARGGEG